MNAKARQNLMDYRLKQEEREKVSFHPKAAFSAHHNRYNGPENDHRLPYKRDADRIIHSKAYARYIDKTQVVYLVDNDHITQRSLHVQFVSHFSRGIAEILGLNVNLVEAIALGHDVGHPPFGHEGEGYLSALSEKYGNGPFAHPLQSCRLLMDIEPLNLGMHVYDGFLCHDGGMKGEVITPVYGKTWEDHFADKEQKIRNPEGNIIPGTLEGCLVKVCDTMSYIGKDIEDAVSLGIIRREDIPETHLGMTNREILGSLAKDVIESSYHKDYIALSPKAFQALKKLRKFNFDRIYMHPRLKVESKKIERSYAILFEYLLQDLEVNDRKSYVWTHFLHNKHFGYLDRSTPVELVIDFISGMTDSYFVRTVEKLIVPSKIEWNA